MADETRKELDARNPPRAISEKIPYAFVAAQKSEAIRFHYGLLHGPKPEELLLPAFGVFHAAPLLVREEKGVIGEVRPTDALDIDADAPARRKGADREPLGMGEIEVEAFGSGLQVRTSVPILGPRRKRGFQTERLQGTKKKKKTRREAEGLVFRIPAFEESARGVFRQTPRGKSARRVAPKRRTRRQDSRQALFHGTLSLGSPSQRVPSGISSPFITMERSSMVTSFPILVS